MPPISLGTENVAVRDSATKKRGSRKLIARETPAVRVNSQKLLQRSQLFDISQDAIFLWRKPGGIEFWNKGATDLYGFKQKEALGHASYKLLQTKFPGSWEEIQKELRTRGSWQGDLRHVTRDGREVIVSSRLQLIPDFGKGILVLESTRDVTDAKRYEQQLERRLREQAVVAQFSLNALRATKIQTICDDAIYMVARELGIDFGALFECLGEGATMLLRSAFGFRPADVGAAQIEINEETEMGRALQLNRPIVISDWRKDEHLRIPEFMRDQKVISSMAVVVQGREHALGVLTAGSKTPRAFGPEEIRFLESIANVLATAISRIQFENEFRDTAARLKGIVDTAVDGIITIDERSIVETMNPAAERIFGYNADEVIGRNVSMLMPEPYHSECNGYLERYHRTGERRTIGIGREVRGLRKDGTEFPLDLGVSSTNLGNRRILTGLLRDITARKRLEQELLEISDREQRRIGSDLHDDLCQRLAGIRFGCDALRKTLGKSGSDHALERLEKIGADVGDAIDRTRMLARGMAPVALERNGLVSALQKLTQAVQKLYGVKCTFRGKENIAIKDPVAATHLYRITQEAINNSLKHGSPSHVVVSLQTRDTKAVLTIADDGLGFSPPEGHRTTEGMGLRTIAYRAGMIEAGFQVQSLPGEGTKIICTFSP